jgi:hypothetical protein
MEEMEHIPRGNIEPALGYSIKNFTENNDGKDEFKDKEKKKKD